MPGFIHQIAPEPTLQTTASDSPQSTDNHPATPQQRTETALAFDKKSFGHNPECLGTLHKGLDTTKSYPIIGEGQALGLDFYTLRSSMPMVLRMYWQNLYPRHSETTTIYDEKDNENAPSRLSTPPPKKRPPSTFVLFSPSRKNKLKTFDEGPAGGWYDGDTDNGGFSLDEWQLD
ncbi:hypothetical protein EC968_002141 [Mortierella alpina]|nr:hypothetical protein EC968_002141 [Mortierella alpina]